MNDNDQYGKEEIHSKVLRAGRRTYFFDVRSTKADDYYLTITESKKHTNENGNSYYKKHKIYLYKEDFENFKEILGEITDFIINERGQEVISDSHQSDFNKHEMEGEEAKDNSGEALSSEANAYTDINFEDI